jgi:arginine exporter protein ArgO
MLDDVIVLGIGVATLSRHRLQEKEGRWLKLVSGLAMIGLGLYLAFAG